MRKSTRLASFHSNLTIHSNPFFVVVADGIKNDPDTYNEAILG